MLRYMLENPFGHWTADGSRFVYDVAKVAEATGYTPEEVKLFGFHQCIRFPRTPTKTRDRQTADGEN